MNDREAHHKKLKLTVAVIFGGRSGEHEVSVISGQSVMNALDKNKFEVLPIYINKKGQWLFSPNTQELIAGIGASQVYLPPEPGKNQLVLRSKTDRENLKIDVVFPVLHGTFGEDGTLQGLLELAGVPYVGAGVLGSALGMDKAMMKKIFAVSGLPVVKFHVWHRDQIYNEELVDAIEKEFGYPFFVKPANMGSSVGISKVHDLSELKPALLLAAKYDRKILIEEGVPEARELEVSVLGNREPEASVVGEIIPGREFYDYEAKYIDDTSELIIPAPLETGEEEKLQQLAIKAFEVLDLRGMARVDFLKSRGTGEIYLNEVNTIPGFTNISMYPKLWAKSGLPYPKLLEKLIDLALEDYRDRAQNRTDFDSKLLTK